MHLCLCILNAGKIRKKKQIFKATHTHACTRGLKSIGSNSSVPRLLSMHRKVKGGKWENKWNSRPRSMHHVVRVQLPSSVRALFLTKRFRCTHTHNTLYAVLCSTTLAIAFERAGARTLRINIINSTMETTFRLIEVCIGASHSKNPFFLNNFQSCFALCHFHFISIFI